MNYYGLKLNHNKTLCPFHNDNNPSFIVNPKKNIATCFACGVTGNAISFIQKYEKLINGKEISVNEAIAKVVEICHLNIDISKIKNNLYNNQYTTVYKKYNDEDRKLLEVNEYLGKLFHYNLTALDKKGKNYLHKRNIDDKQIKDLNLGYSMKGQLLKLAEKNEKIPTSSLIELGYLKIDDNGNLYETFQDRIMIPIHDEKGNIVSFCGRSMGDEKPKYLHTPENVLFQKSKLLYNFYNAKTLAYNNELIIVEGYMDVAGARKVGYENVIATMGVALTDDQLNLIKRNNSSITLALDNDDAGRNAMLRIIPELLKKGFKVDVLDISQIGNYKDFGDMAEANVDFMKIQKSKVSAFNYLLKYKYFQNKSLNVENIYSVFKNLKNDKLITNTYEESLFKEYIMNNSEFNKHELNEIMYPKKIEKKENAFDNFASKAMINYLYLELKKEVDMTNDKVMIMYFETNKDVIEQKLITLFNANANKYLSDKSILNNKILLEDFLKTNKDYDNYESLNRFKYINVFEKTYIKNSHGTAKVKLKDSQIQQVIKQFENSLNDKEKLALEEVEELYIINDLSDIDGILSYKNKSLDILKENIKERMFLNKNKMDFFKFGSLFLNEDKSFIDNQFKGRTGNYKTILFYNNLDNNIKLEKENLITDKESPIKNSINIEKDNNELEQEFSFSVNQVLLVPEFENEESYFVRIPNTGAKEYMYIDKSKCDWVDNGELFYTKLIPNKTYPIYDKNGEYICDKEFNELKINWEDKTKKKEKLIPDENIEKIGVTSNDLIFDNTYISKYKSPISKVYKSKIYLETDKGFYIKTLNSSELIFATKKICNWTDDRSYLIVCPRKNIFNTGISKYSLDGYKKTYIKKLQYNEIERYMKMFYPSSNKKEVLSITIPKNKCQFNSNFINIPIVVDEKKGYISVNIIKTKITIDSVILEMNKDEKLVFHDNSNNYIKQIDSKEVYDYLTEHRENLLSNEEIDLNVPIYEKEAA